jgi:hypothetical protein
LLCFLSSWSVVCACWGASPAAFKASQQDGILAAASVVSATVSGRMASAGETSSTLPACFDLFVDRFFRHTRNKNLQRFNQFIFPKRN